MQITSTTQYKILRLNEVKSLTGLSRSSIYAYMQSGRFPQAIQLGTRSVGWRESSIIAWIDGCKTAKQGVQK
jgi:prophage regulatory protein